MAEMGFSSDIAANTDSNERILLYDIWRLLEGDQKDEISIDDLKVLVMSIAKITDNKRISIQPTDEELKYV